MRGVENVRKLLAFFVAAVLCLPVSVSAAAVHSEIENIDPYTGEPLESYAENGNDGGYARVWVNGTTQYDRDEKMYAYENADVSPNSFYASVADGMFVTEPVEIKIPTGVTPTLYLDGKEISDVNFAHIEEPGAYVLEATGIGATSSRIMEFSILTKITGKLETFTVPEGFTITDARLDGALTSHDAKSVEMTDEGGYVVHYRCNAAERTYSLEVEVDHTPPTLKLEAVKDNVAKGPVDISDMEEGVTANIKLGNKEVKAKDTLTQSGIYHIVLTDQAGNQTTYSFRILMYFNMSSIGFIILLLAAVAALVIYLVISRRKLRVR